MKVTLHSRMGREKYRGHIGGDDFCLITRLLMCPSEMSDNQNYKLVPVMDLHSYMRMFKIIHVKSMNERACNISVWFKKYFP